MSTYDCLQSALTYAEEIDRDLHFREYYEIRDYGRYLKRILQQALEEMPPMPQAVPLGAPVSVDIVPDDAKLLWAVYGLLQPTNPEAAESVRRLILRMIDAHPSLHPEAS